ncbi:hypothetical protein H072_4597 [Dactylellina haptotyla CBS 200.50]|uniref:Ribonuclease H2 subunit B n=1 Tax=Dactylellina haptotyla (strain CBS 200.50) TaxID=1284197 RepID=S8AEL4_DACHA|nr:hypothetical protein H072_4597 [Dactylellina haptotyla CBS 200.50]
MASPRVFILPAGEGSDGSAISHTILSLKHPNTGVPTRYLLHHPPKSEGTSTPFLYEILKIANQISEPRSWLMTPDLPPLKLPKELEKERSDEGEDGDSKDNADGGKEEPQDPPDRKGDKSSLVIKDAHLFLTTPVDPIYLLLSYLTSDKTSRNFLSFDDLLESHPEFSTWTKIFKLHPPAEKLLQSRLLPICDTVEAGDEVMYRVNNKKVIDLLVSRVESVAKVLPPSLTNLITRKLSKPLSLQASTAWKHQAQPEADKTGGIINDAELEDDNKDVESQEVESQLRREASRLNINEEESGTNTPAEADTVITKLVEESLLPPPEILYISQLAHAVQIMKNYIPTPLYTSLVTEIHKTHPLEPLEAYQEELKSLRAAANTAMDFSISHTKRTIEDLEGGVSKEEADREKKRKKKEADGKKSHAVKKLEKADTSGMKKMTAFFKKKD